MKTTLVGKMSAALVALGLTAGPAFAEGQVNILTWEGYADPSFIKQFETESGCKVSATYVGSNDDFAPKLAAGGNVYDIITPSLDTTYTMVDAGFVEPLDTSKITEWNNMKSTRRWRRGWRSEGAPRRPAG